MRRSAAETLFVEMTKRFKFVDVQTEARRVQWGWIRAVGSEKFEGRCSIRLIFVPYAMAYLDRLPARAR